MNGGLIIPDEDTARALNDLARHKMPIIMQGGDGQKVRKYETGSASENQLSVVEARKWKSEKRKLNRY